MCLSSAQREEKAPVPVIDQELPRFQYSPGSDRQVTGAEQEHLNIVGEYPPYGTHLPAGEKQPGQHNVWHQPKPGSHFTREEVCGPQYGHVETDELPPGHSLLALRSWWDA